MGFLSKLISLNSKQAAIKTITPAELAEILRGPATSSGESVTLSSAMRFATVWACVRLLAESIAQLPCHVYTKNSDGSKSRVTDTALAELLSNGPNSWQSPFEYTEFKITALAMTGNHCAQIIRGRRGEPLELIPFVPQSVKLKRDGLNNIRYQVTGNGSVKTYTMDEINHVRGLTFDGFWGVSPITYHRETIGLSMAAQSYGSKLFKNGARPAGVLRVLNTLSEDAYLRLKKYWQQMYSGDNVGKTAILEEGTEYQTVSMSNEDAQYLDVRQFQRSEICSIYRIPPHMIGDLTKASFSNITQQSLEFVKYTILPWCKRDEAAMMRDLLTPEQRRNGMFVEYLVDGLERADIKTRYEAYRTAINGGWMSPNEARKRENMNPRENGDIYPMQINLTDSSVGLPSPKYRLIKSSQIKGIQVREDLRRKFKPRFKNVGSTVVTAEVAAVRKHIAWADPAELLDLVEGFYAAFPETIKETFKALVREYAYAVKNAAAKEAGGAADIDLGKLSEFITDMLDGLSTRHTISSLNQLKSLILQSDPDKINEAVEQRLSEWEERRPDKIAEREVVQQESAISRFAWAAAGVQSLVWVNRGSKSCPFCTSLHGKVVGISSPFVDEGNYEPDGHDSSPWKIKGPKMHAPIHQGCQCAIVPGE